MRNFFPHENQMLIILYFFSVIFRTQLRVAKKKNKQCFNEAFDRLKRFSVSDRLVLIDSYLFYW